MTMHSKDSGHRVYNTAAKVLKDQVALGVQHAFCDCEYAENCSGRSKLKKKYIKNSETLAWQGMRYP